MFIYENIRNNPKYATPKSSKKYLDYIEKLVEGHML